MWQIDVEEYNRLAEDSFPAERLYFRTKQEALIYADHIKSLPCNCSIWLTELIEKDGDLFDTNNVTCLQSIIYD
jgi:hypothetical protein